MALTQAQIEAIETTDNHLQIIACAGSGKTDVVSRRIARIIKLKLAKPEEIVAFTFTEKAAAELKERVYKYISEEVGNSEGLADMFIGTMHGYCLELLQTYVPEVFKFSVLSEVQAKLLVNRFSNQSGLTTCPTLSPGTPVLRRYTGTRLYMSALSIYREDTVDESLISSGFRDSVSSYLSLLDRHSYLDYTDILTRAIDSIEGSSERHLKALYERVQSYKFITVDEYQDINPIQERLVSAITNNEAKLCVVGDDDQTIYQWRGSEVQNILSFARRKKKVTQIFLEDNFRSSKGIVDVARIVANNIDPTIRLPKAMNASGHQEFERGDVLNLDFTSQQTEASWIASKIQSMLGIPFRDSPNAESRGMTYSDFAILFRSVRKDAGLLVDEFKRLNIPFIIKGLSRLFEADEIIAIQAAFRYAAEEIDQEEFDRLWTAGNLTSGSDKLALARKRLESIWTLASSSKFEKLNLQELFLEYLEALDIKESSYPLDPSRGEIVFSLMGKFSQVISDFESINFKTDPAEKLRTFSQWLINDAPGVYEEAYADSSYVVPNAVVISTVHQAKGMQWPVVFVPSLQRNRFPSKVNGGLNISHMFPANAIQNFDRYRGSEDDERRLFYVAVTRSQKYLFMSFAPGGSNLYSSRSIFLQEAAASSYVNTVDSKIGKSKVPQSVKPSEFDMTLTFSELKYLFECGYQFKIRFMYGFQSPIAEAMGYGRGLHDALSEIHKKAIEGEILTEADAEMLVSRHLWTPFANEVMKENLRISAVEAVKRYFRNYGEDLSRTIHSEKRIQLHLGDGLMVDGRIDLIRKLDTDEVAIVDFKSKETAQTESLTTDQLQVYALGYKELTGEPADVLEILNLDENGRNVRIGVSEELLNETFEKVRAAGQQIKNNELAKHKNWCSACTSCDFAGLCRTRK
jgi:DNA helicase-2/ATP-dependent DNA helicase PcrA